MLLIPFAHETTAQHLQFERLSCLSERENGARDYRHDCIRKSEFGEQMCEFMENGDHEAEPEVLDSKRVAVPRLAKVFSVLRTAKG